MIKHEYQKQSENGTVNDDSRTKNLYTATLIASEKNRMKMLDSKKETDVNSPDVVQYATREAIPTVYTGSFYATNIYTGGGKAAAKKPAPKTDLEKHIYESERYYIDITNGAQKVSETEPEDKKSKKPVPSTMEISVFEPKNFTFPEEETLVYKKEESEPAPGIVTAENTAAQTSGVIGYGIAPEDEEGSAAQEKASAAQTVKGTSKKEYTSPSQNKELRAELRSKCILSKVRISFAVLFCIALFVIENISAVKESFATPLAYIVVDWLLAFACAVLVFDRICLAFRSLIRFRADADCVTLIAFFFSFAATALALLVETPDQTVYLYNFPFAVCVFFNTLFVYCSARRDMYSFSVLSSEQDKRAVILTAPVISPSDAEEELLSQEDMETTYGKVKNVEFIEDYFAHKEDFSNAKKPLQIILLFCFGISVIFFLCALLAMQHSVAESVAVAYAAFMMCAPVSAFLAYSLPLYLAARRTHARQSAILCDKTPDLYRNVSMVVFRDSEVFSSGQAKVKSIRLYADKKIENAIYYASSIYSAIGGPLADVFKKAALNSVSSENVELVEVCAEGACAMVDGKNIVIGTPSYMEEQCFETVNDAGDEEYEGKTNKRIFYLACDHIVIAKFYIQYAVGSAFLDIANRLFSAGIGIGIATADPCLDIGVFYENKIDPEQNAIRVLKGYAAEPAEKSVSARKAGIVSTGSTMDLVKAILVCGKLENVKKTHLVLKIVSSILGVAAMALILFTGKAPEMISVYPALYQLFWMLPVYFVSKVYL